METIYTLALIVTLIIGIYFSCKGISLQKERDEALEDKCRNKKLNKKLQKEIDEALDLNDELISQLGIADKNIAELERENDKEIEEVSRWNLNYQSMRREKMKFQKFLIDFKEGDGDKIDKLLKGMLSENKYLKAKKQKDEIDINKQG